MLSSIIQLYWATSAICSYLHVVSVFCLIKVCFFGDFGEVSSAKKPSYISLFAKKLDTTRCSITSILCGPSGAQQVVSSMLQGSFFMSSRNSKLFCLYLVLLEWPTRALAKGYTRDSGNDSTFCHTARAMGLYRDGNEFKKVLKRQFKGKIHVRHQGGCWLACMIVP